MLRPATAVLAVLAAALAVVPGVAAAGQGPVAAADIRACAQVGMDVRYLDDWRTHVSVGEVHCGTNTIRAAGTAWWSPPRDRQP